MYDRKLVDCFAFDDFISKYRERSIEIRIHWGISLPYFHTRSSFQFLLSVHVIITSNYVIGVSYDVIKIWKMTDVSPWRILADFDVRCKCRRRSRNRYILWKVCFCVVFLPLSSFCSPASFKYFLSIFYIFIALDLIHSFYVIFWWSL